MNRLISYAMLCGTLTMLALPALATPVSLTTSKSVAEARFLSGSGTVATASNNTGTSTKPVFKFDNLAAGSYMLSLYNADGNSLGSIDVIVPETEVEQPFEIGVAQAYVTNKDADENLWQCGVDFTFPADRLYVGSQTGILRNSVPETLPITVSKVEYTALSFLFYSGDSFNIVAEPTGNQPDYSANSVYVTTSTCTLQQKKLTLALAQEYTFTVPSISTFFLGSKRNNYVPFEEQIPVRTTTEGDMTTYTYKLKGGSQTYNFRITTPGYMVYAGKCSYSDKYPVYSQTVTLDQIKANGTPRYYNHDVTEYTGGNLADIMLNINERNHLRMQKGETFQIVPVRTWQLIDNQSNNYFIEPTYTIRVLDTDFQPLDDLLEVDQDTQTLRALREGTGIVQVDYDATYVVSLNGIGNDFMPAGQNNNFWFGNLWSCLWAENMGTFVVTVGTDATGDLKPDFHSVTPMARDRVLDSELDVLYYLESEPGFEYTFSPTGAAKVSVANPEVDTEANTVSYAGFRDVEAAADGSYTLLLTYGRNIIRVEDAAGNAAYQVISAKPMGYEITNVTNPDATIAPEDEILVQLHGLFHPTPKMASVYNQSAAPYYDGYDTSKLPLILTPAQYAFGGSASAQQWKIKVPQDAEKPYDLEKCCIFVKGYGDIGGLHRGLNRAAGRNPNFKAPVTSQYWGVFPSITIPVGTTLGIDGVAAAEGDIRVNVIGGAIRIYGYQGEALLYSVAGALSRDVMISDDSLLSVDGLQDGIYILRLGERSFKIKL